ncbi:MAG: hypothetical protein KAU60_13120, partial [Desulfobacterales bacterium]|nr:hypothetical protein [Desulfobacterales bacterium]
GSFFICQLFLKTMFSAFASMQKRNAHRISACRLFMFFFHHEAHEEHIFVPLRGLIFPYNPDHPACPPISGGYIVPAP